MTFTTIEAQINILKDYADDTQFEALNKLHAQLNQAANAEWTKDELSNLIKSDDDVLDNFEKDTAFYEAVREIQDGIILFFGT